MSHVSGLSHLEISTKCHQLGYIQVRDIILIWNQLY